jgi:hypothetical protein
MESAIINQIHVLYSKFISFENVRFNVTIILIFDLLALGIIVLLNRKKLKSLVRDILSYSSQSFYALAIIAVVLTLVIVLYK